MSKINENNKINIWSQLKTRRVFVACLSRSSVGYLLEYDEKYRLAQDAIPVGPELSLFESRHSSEKLFPSILDRLPSKKNPAYPDYCRQWGVDPEEEDLFVLLTTIARRGPSTFVFEPADESEFGIEALVAYRKKLELNQREFAALFDLNQATLARMETGHSQNSLVLNYIELCEKVPEAFAHILEKRGQYLHDEKRVKLLSHLGS